MKTSPRRRLFYLAIAGALAVVSVPGLMAVYDSVHPPAANRFVPVSRDSALEAWRPIWEPEEEAEACASMPEKWMVIGWDGASWDLLLPLVEEGKMPHLAALMESGSYGTLHSFQPTVSPALWTTVATGVSPARHGILDFYNQKPRWQRWVERLLHFGHLDRQLFTNADRRVRAAWNQLSELDRSVFVVGYHNTFPAEDVSGMMVSNHLVQDVVGDVMRMGTGDSSFSHALVSPVDDLPEILAIQESVQESLPENLSRFVSLAAEEVDDFLRRAEKLDHEGDQRPYFLARAYIFDTINAVIAERFLPRLRPDVAFLHFQSLDWAAHKFLYFHVPEWFTEVEWSSETRSALDAELPRYRHTVEAFHRNMDEWLGRFLELRDPETAVMILSDHGFRAGSDPRDPGFHDDAPPGMLVLNGPGIRQGHRLPAATLYDILPTLMAGLELPVAEDLEGEILAGVFCDSAWESSRQSTVASYESGERYVPEVTRPPTVDREILEQLESLGYLD